MEQQIGGGENPRPPSKMEKVAFSIFKYFPFGGLQLEMMRFAREFVRRGIRVVIFCMDYDETEDVPPEITFRVLPAKGWCQHTQARNFEKHLAAVLQEEDFFTHITFNRLAPADWHFAADFPAGDDSKRSLWQKLSPRYRTFSLMEEQLFAPESSTGILCSTRKQQERYQAIYNTPDERFHLLPPGIDAAFANAVALREKRDELRDKLGIGKDENLLIQVTSAFRSKGIDRSIAALASLPEEIRNKTRLLIVGRGKAAPYAKFASRCSVGKQVVFTGTRNDVAELIAASDLMIHPARNEATGTALLESLACGTPVLCSANCGYSPLVKEAGSVVLPRLFRQKILNRTLMVLLSTPGKLADLQQEAENYGRSGDFYRREKVAVDMITGAEEQKQ